MTDQQLTSTALLVRRILCDADGPLTVREIASEEPDLPERTTYDAVDRLEAAGIVERIDSTCATRYRCIRPPSADCESRK